MDYSKELHFEYQNLLNKLNSTNNKDLIFHLKNLEKRLVACKSEVVIKDDWVTKAESLLPFVENAIYENRQFIREDGEVLPIEKVKRITKASITNLAKHSEYISHVTEDDENIIPDKLYTVAKDTDFSVYENKFLYLLLTTLKNFIETEKEDIYKAIESGYYKLTLSKKLNIESIADTLDCEITFKAVGDKEKNEKIDKILNRIDIVEGQVNALLSLNLMVELSKYPLIDSNITKTNVLRMNENFKNCVELYEYVTRYDEDTIESTVSESKMDLSDSSKKELDVLALLLENVTYKSSFNLESSYNEAYDARLKEIEDEKAKALDMRIDELKAKGISKSDTEYVMLLEDKIEKLSKLNAIVSELEAKNSELSDRLVELNNAFKEKNDELILKSEEVIRLNLDLSQVSEKVYNNKNEFDTLNEEIESLKKIIEEKNKDILSEQEENRRLMTIIEDKDKEINNLEMDKIKILEDCNKSLEVKNDEITELRASLLAKGIKTLDDYTTEDGFNELEREYKFIEKIYKEEWKKTKKRIKKEVRSE